MIGARLVGWIEIARLGRRLERAHDHPRGIGTQIERLTVQEAWLVTKCPRSFDQEVSFRRTARNAGRSSRRRDARKLAHLGKAEQVGDDGLAAAVFVGTIGMQSIAAAAGLQIDQRHRQIVAAEKPGECARGVGFPLGIAVRTPGRQAGRDRRGGFQRLLIERARVAAADRRSCASRRGGNDPPASSAAPSASAAIAGRRRRRQACASRCLSSIKACGRRALS